MNIVRTILASIVILYVWIWLINTAFGKHSLKIQYIWKTILIWIILVGGLFSYKYLLSHSATYGIYNIVDHLDISSVLIFSWYCVAILAAILFVFRKRALFILEILFTGAIFFLIVGFWWIVLGINSLILYYIISAYAEEYLKYTSSTTLLKNWYNDIKNGIFFCILLGLGFSLIENIFYLISLAGTTENIAGLIIGRWLISALIHVVATTTIWAIYYALSKKIIRPVALFIAIIWWVLLHGGYNLGLAYQLSFVTIPLIIFLFFLFSFFLFKSDMLYIKKEG